jgi:hypothetical protein
MSVRQAQMQISSAEFTEWLAYYELEPFGDQVADMRHGTSAALLANINRNAKERPEPFLAADFINWGERAQGAEDEEAEPALLDDPVAQSNLIRAAMFGMPPR